MEIGNFYKKSKKEKEKEKNNLYEQLRVTLLFDFTVTKEIDNSYCSLFINQLNK